MVNPEYLYGVCMASTPYFEMTEKKYPVHTQYRLDTEVEVSIILRCRHRGV